MHCGKSPHCHFPELKSHTRLRGLATGPGLWQRVWDMDRRISERWWRWPMNGNENFMTWCDFNPRRVTSDPSAVEVKSEQLWWLCGGICCSLECVCLFLCVCVCLKRWEFGKFCDVIFSMGVSWRWLRLISRKLCEASGDFVCVCLCIWCMWGSYPGLACFQTICPSSLSL